MVTLFLLSTEGGGAAAAARVVPAGPWVLSSLFCRSFHFVFLFFLLNTIFVLSHSRTFLLECFFPLLFLSSSGGSGCRMTDPRVTAFFLLSLGSIFAFASFHDFVYAAASPAEDSVYDSLIQLNQDTLDPRNQDRNADHDGASDTALPHVTDEGQGEEPAEGMFGEIDPEDSGPDEQNDTRPLEDRPRTTKHLYTTRRTNARGSTRAGGLSGAKLFSVLALLFMGALVYAFRGKIFGPEEEDEHDEEEERAGSVSDPS